MTKATGSFITLVGILIFSSIVYIWQSEAEKKSLQTQITAQQIEIENLKSKLETLEPTNLDFGEVQGVTTATGTISGTITLQNLTKAEALIVCAQEVRTKQEHCTDFFLEPSKSQYTYSFEIPQGRYEIYSILPPIDTKTFYSEVSNCDSNSNCVTNPDKKRLIQVSAEETQANIDISL